MSSLFYSDAAFLQHDTGPGHPERIARLQAVAQGMSEAEISGLELCGAPLAAREDLLLVHPERYVDLVTGAAPQEGFVGLDPDTVMSPGSLEAALRAAGAVVEATEKVIGGAARNGFVAARPPGHHAEPEKAMGFCIFSNVAIAARRALREEGIERVAIVDFDVHHGNGTQHALEADSRCLYISSHQFPYYPGTGASEETGVSRNVVNAPLAAGDGWIAFKQAYEDRLLPALDSFRPDFLLISAGFDAHRDDPLAQLELEDEDYDWVSGQLLELAERHCNGRVVSVLEGGYNLDVLQRCVPAHVRQLAAAAEK